jgi:DNA-binding transcriptional MerR regulator
VEQRQFVSIGGLAARLGVSTSAIRKWECQGIIPAAARLEGSDRRVYSLADLEAIRERVEARRRQAQRGAPAPTAA